MLCVCVCVFGFGPSITQVRECSMLDSVIRCHRDVTRGDCVETRGLADRTGLGSSSSTTPGLFQLVLILGCFCTDAAPLHTCAWCQLAVRKEAFRLPAHSHAKHSSHFWKPLGTHPHPCSELHAASWICVWKPERTVAHCLKYFSIRASTPH